MDHAATTPVSTDIASAERKTYVAPTLTDFGSFSEITQGTFGGVGVDNTVYS
jgi:hypothetical protein